MRASESLFLRRYARSINSSSISIRQWVKREHWCVNESNEEQEGRRILNGVRYARVQKRGKKEENSSNKRPAQIFRVNLSPPDPTSDCLVFLIFKKLKTLELLPLQTIISSILSPSHFSSRHPDVHFIKVLFSLTHSSQIPPFIWTLQQKEKINVTETKSPFFLSFSVWQENCNLMLNLSCLSYSVDHPEYLRHPHHHRHPDEHLYDHPNHHVHRHQHDYDHDCAGYGDASSVVCNIPVYGCHPSSQQYLMASRIGSGGSSSTSSWATGQPALQLKTSTLGHHGSLTTQATLERNLENNSSGNSDSSKINNKILGNNLLSSSVHQLLSSSVVTSSQKLSRGPLIDGQRRDYDSTPTPCLVRIQSKPLFIPTGQYYFSLL